MNLHLPKYREVKDKYCVCYFGPCDDFIAILLGLREQVEKALPGLRMYIGCRDNLCVNESTIPESSIIQMVREPWGTEFGHIRELRCNTHDHPVEQFLKESGLNLPPVIHRPEPENRTVKMYTQGTAFSRSLTPERAATLAAKYAKAGYEVSFGGDWRTAGTVVGVECGPFWEAAMAGKSAVLCNTGLGAGFFRVMCPWGEVISE